MKFLTSLIMVIVLTSVLASPQQQGKRRKIKKKILKKDNDESDSNLKNHQMNTNIDKPKEGRGFLDNYYTNMFESRTEKAQQQSQRQYDQMASETVGDPRTINTQYEIQNHPAASERRQESEDQQLSDLIFKEQQLQQLLARESELTPAQREELLRQLSQWPEFAQQEGQIVQQLPALPEDNGDAYLYSSNLMQDISDNGIAAMDERHDVGTELSPYSKYLSEALSPDLTNRDALGVAHAVDNHERDGGDHHGSSYKSVSTSSASQYLGLTGTTSQDIQLGLTFTVPFLSVPLGSINNLLGGNFGDIGSFFNINNLDVGTIATFAVIAIAAIFVLPQAIYWVSGLTGVNLPSFNWGRSDDGEGSGIVELANTIDTALTEFNVDGKGCIAKSLCETLYDEEKKSSNMIVTTIVNTALKNDNMNEFLGEEKMKMLQEYGKIADKYSSYPKTIGSPTCDSVFRSSTCPWDSKGITSIVMKLMASQGTSFADLALKAASAAASKS